MPEALNLSLRDDRMKAMTRFNLDLGMKYGSPWNLLTLALGLGLLIAGSFYYQAPDWDIPISIIMAGFTYLYAAKSLQTVITRQWRRFPVMLLATWWTVDGCYALYWCFKDPVALQWMREANWPASLALYAACGLVWSLPNISVKSSASNL